MAETTCHSLLRELERIWDEVGESDDERDRMLLQLEQECLEVYRRKVDQANFARARLHQSLADSEAELASLLSVLGDRPLVEKRTGTLREQLCGIVPQIESLRLKKEERAKQIQVVKLQIEKLSIEISGVPHPVEDTSEDLSLRKLNEYENQLHALQLEQSNRLHKVLGLVGTLKELCLVLTKDFSETVKELHPSLSDSTAQMSVSDGTLDKLTRAIDSLAEERRQRMQQLQDLAASLTEMWNLMDIPFEERREFKSVTRTLVTSEQENICQEPGSLGLDIMEKAKGEVRRLELLKISKMKELILKKQAELVEICSQAHMDCDANLTEEKVTTLLDSGLIDPSELLENIEESIATATEESLSRKEIMEKMEKWMAACEEEGWLEDYSKDESRFNAGRGAHLNLKRAERARVIVAKLPALLESLRSKTRGWEDERGRPFLYSGVSLLEILENYNLMKKEKEEEKRRSREQKKLQEQFLTEQELLYGSTKQLQNQRKGALRPVGNNANCRLSLEPSIPRAAGNGHGAHQQQKGAKDAGGKRRLLPPLPNYVALAKDDASSIASCESAPNSPLAV